MKKVTGADAGLSGDEQIRLSLKRIIGLGGVGKMGQLYSAIEEVINQDGFTLSTQGKASLRFFINKVAVEAGYIYPHDKNNPGWRITPEGRHFIENPEAEPETVVNVDTGEEEKVQSSSVRGAAFENWTLKVLRASYPFYAWYHQGVHKNNERGLDFIGERIGDSNREPKNIGVQVKFHKKSNAPTVKEWLLFLSGCFSRRVDAAIFITTGKLTGNQHREAQEARVVVIEGVDEITRIAELNGIKKFSLFEG